MKKLHISADITNTTDFRHTWEGLVNIDQFKWLGRSDVNKVLKMAKEELKAHTVRGAGMYNYDSRCYDKDPLDFIHEERRGKQRTNWQIIDAYFDNCLDAGITPMFTTCFTPEHMASDTKWKCFDGSCTVSPPKDWSVWSKFVKESVEHIVWRYGKARAREFMYEVWNEPNLEGSFWVSGKEGFFKLWKVTYDAIKSVDSDLQIGGPSTARGEWIKDLLEFGKANDCLPDYLISHIYNHDSAVSDQALSPFAGPQTDLVNHSPNYAAGVMKGVKQVADDFGFKGEIHWNEWGRSWFPAYPDRENPNEAAYIVKTMAEASQDADYYAYWCLSDIYNQLGYGKETFHGNYGATNLQRIRKPAWHAHQLLTTLGHKRAEAKVEGGDDCSNAIVTSCGSSQQCLAYVFQADETPRPEKTTVEFAVPEVMAEDITIYLVDDKHNNAVARWKAQGSPDYLKPEEAEVERRASELKKLDGSRYTIKDEGEMTIVRVDMTGPGIAWIGVE